MPPSRPDPRRRKPARMTTSRSDEYARLAEDAEQPTRVVDHRGAWERLTPLLGVNGATRARVEAFAKAKRISLEALAALGTRIKVDAHGEVELAWGYRAGDAVTAVKFRPLGDKKRYALAPSVFVEPLMVGQVRSLDWFVAEGETDGARLFDLVGDVAAILVLSAGAKTFKREWAAIVPRGARVFLAHDGDEAGDAGATKATRILGGQTVRVRPPDGFKDWCEWGGGREEFVELVQAAGKGHERRFALPLEAFIAERSETPPALIGDETENLLPAFGLLILFAKGGKGKTTIIVDAALHFASGVDWLGFKIERPLHVLFIENEGPREPFRAKLELKRKLWEHEIRGAIHVQTYEWGAFTLADNN